MSNVTAAERRSDILTTAEAIEFLNVSRSTLARLAKRHGVRRIKSGKARGKGLVRWSRKELEKLLATMTRVAK